MSHIEQGLAEIIISEAWEQHDLLLLESDGRVGNDEVPMMMMLTRMSLSQDDLSFSKFSVSPAGGYHDASLCP